MSHEEARKHATPVTPNQYDLYLDLDNEWRWTREWYARYLAWVDSLPDEQLEYELRSGVSVHNFKSPGEHAPGGVSRLMECNADRVAKAPTYMSQDDSRGWCHVCQREVDLCDTDDVQRCGHWPGHMSTKTYALALSSRIPNLRVYGHGAPTTIQEALYGALEAQAYAMWSCSAVGNPTKGVKRVQDYLHGMMVPGDLVIETSLWGHGRLWERIGYFQSRVRERVASTDTTYDEYDSDPRYETATYIMLMDGTTMRWVNADFMPLFRSLDDVRTVRDGVDVMSSRSRTEADDAVSE